MARVFTYTMSAQVYVNRKPFPSPIKTPCTATRSKKEKILFGIARTEYQREIERHKTASSKATKMVSFTGLLFTIYSFLVVHVMLVPQAENEGLHWTEWAAYAVSIALMILNSVGDAIADDRHPPRHAGGNGH
ncbi:MAG: hypothetical protein D8H94_16600 [Cardiobacterium sp.]|nr:MAG: hypothetical protein D8H94_16600 [Cardiobacterium sp.]